MTTESNGDVWSALASLAAAQVRTEERLGDLAVAQARTEERLAALAKRMDELAAAQRSTDERLGELAQRVDALTERVDALTERVDALTARVDALTARVDALTARVDALTARVDALAEQVGALTEQVGALVSQVSKLGTQVDTLRGDALERRCREFGFAYFRAIARRLRLLTCPDLDDLLETAVEEGSLDEDSSDQVRLADAVFRGSRRSDGVPCYVVVEASIGIGVHDVTRAGERAALLARSGTPAEAVVAGEWISREAAQAADDLGVWQVTNGRATPPGSAKRGPLGVVE